MDYGGYPSVRDRYNSRDWPNQHGSLSSKRDREAENDWESSFSQILSRTKKNITRVNEKFGAAGMFQDNMPTTNTSRSYNPTNSGGYYSHPGSMSMVVHESKVKDIQSIHLLCLPRCRAELRIFYYIFIILSSFCGYFHSFTFLVTLLSTNPILYFSTRNHLIFMII